MGLRAIFSGISGLQGHSTWLDVIGNNVSNVNTVGYKAARLTFSDQVSQTLFGGSGSNTASNLGGVNPQQVGLGTRVSSIQTLFTAGPTLNTGNATDVAIQGNGFFVVERGNQTLFSRAGNLTFDSEGFLVDANGGLIQGFNAQVRFNTRVFHSDSADATGAALGVPAEITDASLVLDTTNTSNIQSIRVQPGMVLPPRATTIMDFVGNLDSFLEATDTQRGGLVNITTAGVANIPLGEGILAGLAMFNATKATAVDTTGAGDYVIDQIADFALPQPADPLEVDPVVVDGVDLSTVRATGGYVWDTGTVPPAHTMSQTVFDSLGNPREITFLLYQVNDIGAFGINPQPGPSQVAYAWYAFETTGGVQPATANLLGGTGIIEGDQSTGFGTLPGYDRGVAGDQYVGDLLYFNTDGSLASRGATQMLAGGGGFEPATARIYLPPINQDPNAVPPMPGGPPVSPLPTIGAEVLAIDLNFGTDGPLGLGRRDGLFSDAQGQFQVINGVNTYIPQHTAFVEDQDGYRDGTLQSVAFDQTGILKGTFSNGEIIDLAQIVMARVANPEGLNRLGNGYFGASPNSGSVFIGLAGQGGLGTVQGFALEGSNVDLTVELSNMIIAQRGFEVNARTISVNNQTLDTLVNLGR